MSLMAISPAIILAIVAIIVVCPGLKPLAYRPFVIRRPVNFISDKVFAFEAMYNSRVTGKASGLCAVSGFCMKIPAATAARAYVEISVVS